MPIAKLAYRAMLFALLPCASLLGQSTAPATPLQTSHIHGTVRSAYEDSPLPGTKVTFKGKGISTTVYTDGAGVYQGDLPAGAYTMTAEPPDHRFPTYERPLFRVASSAGVTIDVSIPSEVMVGCDIGVRPGRKEPDPDDYVNACGGSVSFPVHSEDGVPFEVLIQFGRREPSEHGYIYSAAWKLSVEPPYINRSDSNSPGLGTQVFAAYNLFTLRADHVIYDVQTRTLQATGKVVATNADGETQRADSMTFKIENGQATPLP